MRTVSNIAPECIVLCEAEKGSTQMEGSPLLHCVPRAHGLVISIYKWRERKIWSLLEPLRVMLY